MKKQIILYKEDATLLNTVLDEALENRGHRNKFPQIRSIKEQLKERQVTFFEDDRLLIVKLLLFSYARRTMADPESTNSVQAQLISENVRINNLVTVFTVTSSQQTEQTQYGEQKHDEKERGACTEVSCLEVSERRSQKTQKRAR